MEHLKFLNHSCLLIGTSTTKILCDPWFKGTAFGGGWSLLYDNSHDINELDFDYIWISHEHPDHFSIPTILELRKRCRFLFQETKDKKVKNFLERAGHDVIELKHKEVTKIGDLELASIVCDGYDSSLLVKYPDGKVLLNINDARVELDSHLEAEIEPLLHNSVIDLLAFQFSYANWAGNNGDKVTPGFLQKLTDKKNNEVISKLRPRIIMPFASFVYFSHEENFFWNENRWLEHIIEEFSSNQSTLVFPAPNQTIDLGAANNYSYADSNNSALAFWLEKQKEIKIIGRSNPRSLEEIRSSYYKFNKELNNANDFLKTAKPEENIFITIRITDLDKVIKVGLIECSFEVVDGNESMSVSSETLDFLFTQLFARGTISINGRVSFNYELAHTFFLFFFIPYANNIGLYFTAENPITKELLMSILRTSVMICVGHHVSGFARQVERDIDKFISVFM